MKSMITIVLAFCAVYCTALRSDAAAAPGDAIKSANQRSDRAEAKFTECGNRFQGALIVDCVALAVKAFALDVGGCGFIKAVAPKAASTVKAAANEIGIAKTKEAALSVLNKTTAILRNLSATTAGEAKSVYSRINRALDVAVGVIDKKAQ